MNAWKCVTLDNGSTGFLNQSWLLENIAGELDSGTPGPTGQTVNRGTFVPRTPFTSVIDLESGDVRRLTTGGSSRL